MFETKSEHRLLSAACVFNGDNYFVAWGRHAPDKPRVSRKRGSRLAVVSGAGGLPLFLPVSEELSLLRCQHHRSQARNGANATVQPFSLG
jgi:hypothetical protein